MAADVNKKTLADSLVLRNPELTKKAALELVDVIFDEIANAVKDNKKVDITGFGKFTLKTRKARTGINPSTKETIEIPSSSTPGFRPAKAFKDLVK